MLRAVYGFPTDCFFGLDMQFNAFMGTYMLIYSYTHKSENDWLEGGMDFIKNKLNAKSLNTIKTALDKLTKSGLIVSRVRNTIRGNYTDYRINEQILSDMGIFDNEEEFIPDEPDFVCDMNAMDFPEPEPEFVPEPIQLYGKYQNVRLTESEYRELDEQFGTVFTETTLKRFSTYVFNSQKYSTYADHSEILKVWCGEDKVKAEKSAEKNYNQNLSKICSEFETSNKYNKSIYKNSCNSLSQSATSEKNDCSDKMNFYEVLDKIGFTYPYGDDLTEYDFNDREKCVLSYDFVGNPRAMLTAIKFMFADDYNQRHNEYNLNLSLCADGFLQSLAELASQNFVMIKKQKVYGTDVVDKINRLLKNEHPVTVLENFMDFYADAKSKTTVRDTRTFMRAIWWDFLDSDVRTASNFSDLCFLWNSNNRNSDNDFLNLL